jgi:hypothetical protein
MKTCSKCKLNLSLSNFSKDSQKKDGLHSHCRQCRSIVCKSWRLKNKDEVNEKQKQYRLKNIESIRKKDLERNKNLKRKAYKNSRNRYYLLKNRSLNKSFVEEIKKIYEDCAQLCKVTGNKYEVDHIIPLKGENVCGLHVPWNLQIISQFENRSKGNIINYNPQRTNEPRD